MSQQKILITGAAGFIGSHLVDLLLDKKIPRSRLRLLVKPGESLDNLPDDRFDIVYADIRDQGAIKKAMHGVDTVYHLAARIDFDGQTYDEYYDVNVLATQHLVDAACRKKKFKKFILYSSIGVYGLPAGIGDIEGWDETHPKTYTNYYGRSKWEAEKVVMRAHRQHGLPYAIIRPASVYGPREKGPTLALYSALQSGRFAMIGDGQNKMHYVYVTDLVEATYLAARSRKKTGDYIIAGAKPTPFNEIVHAVATSIDAPPPKVRISKQMALAIAYPLEAIGKVIGVKPPLFPSRVRTMTTTYYYDIRKARRELGYNPKVSFKQGAKLTGVWYRSKGWV